MCFASLLSGVCDIPTNLHVIAESDGVRYQVVCSLTECIIMNNSNTSISSSSKSISSNSDCERKNGINMNACGMWILGGCNIFGRQNRFYTWIEQNHFLLIWNFRFSLYSNKQHILFQRAFVFFFCSVVLFCLTLVNAVLLHARFRCKNTCKQFSHSTIYLFCSPNTWRFWNNVTQTYYSMLNKLFKHVLQWTKNMSTTIK